MTTNASSADRQKPPANYMEALTAILSLLGEIHVAVKPKPRTHYVVDADGTYEAARRQMARAFDRAAAEPLTSPRARLINERDAARAEVTRSISERDAARVELAETQAALRASESEVRRLAAELKEAQIRTREPFARSSYPVAHDAGDVFVQLATGPMQVDWVEVLRVRGVSDGSPFQVEEVWVQVRGRDIGPAPTPRMYTWGPGQAAPVDVREFLARVGGPADSVEPQVMEGDR